MKRRVTKKALRDTEGLVMDSLCLYFERPRYEGDTSEKLSRDIVALSLSMLLNFHLQLNPLGRVMFAG
jgi:hypothetical protein